MSRDHWYKKSPLLWNTSEIETNKDTISVSELAFRRSVASINRLKGKNVKRDKGVRVAGGVEATNKRRHAVKLYISGYSSRLSLHICQSGRFN